MGSPALQRIASAVPIPLGRDDRIRPDRRRRPTPMFSRHTFFGGRRWGGRRAGETENVFVDLHGPRLLIAALAVVALNVLDAFFTLLFLSAGGQEANPLVVEVLRWGTGPFLFLKSVGIGLCVTFLVVAKNFRVARIGMGLVLVGYTLLLGWHLFLLWQIRSA